MKRCRSEKDYTTIQEKGWEEVSLAIFELFMSRNFASIDASHDAFRTCLATGLNVDEKSIHIPSGEELTSDMIKNLLKMHTRLKLSRKHT